MIFSNVTYISVFKGNGGGIIYDPRLKFWAVLSQTQLKLISNGQATDIEPVADHLRLPHLKSRDS